MPPSWPLLELRLMTHTLRLRGALCGAGHRAFHMDPLGNLTRCNTVAQGHGNLLLGRAWFDERPSPCPVKQCACGYQGLKYAEDDPFGA